MKHKIGLGKIAATIHAYPTLPNLPAKPATSSTKRG